LLSCHFSYTNFTVGLSYVDALDRLRVHLNIILFFLYVDVLRTDSFAYNFQISRKVHCENPETTDTEKMSDTAREVVISGFSGRFPESDNIAEFREHLINGDDMVTEDDRRWEPGRLVYVQGGRKK